MSSSIDLNSILEWNGKRDAINREFLSILITQSLNVHGGVEFLFLHFLNEFMSRKSETIIHVAVFLTFNHAPHHYKHIQRKLGLNLDQWLSKEHRMIFIDATNCFNPYAHFEVQEALAMLVIGNSDRKEVFEKLNEVILTQLDVLRRNYPIGVTLVPLLIIDDLTTLIYAGYSIDDILNFTHHFMKHIENVGIQREAPPHGILFLTSFINVLPVDY
jgi:hypothetical protein